MYWLSKYNMCICIQRHPWWIFELKYSIEYEWLKFSYMHRRNIYIRSLLTWLAKNESMYPKYSLSSYSLKLFGLERFNLGLLDASKFNPKALTWNPVGNYEVELPKAGMVFIWVTILALDFWCTERPQNHSGRIWVNWDIWVSLTFLANHVGPWGIALCKDMCWLACPHQFKVFTFERRQ